MIRRKQSRPALTEEPLLGAVSTCYAPPPKTRHPCFPPKKADHRDAVASSLLSLVSKGTLSLFYRTGTDRKFLMVERVDPLVTPVS